MADVAHLERNLPGTSARRRGGLLRSSKKMSDRGLIMNVGTRACVAYIAADIIGGKAGSSAYDHARGKHVLVTKQGAAHVYDHERGCHVTGSGSGGNYNLYDHGIRNHVQLQLSGKNFTGYDHASGRHFQGSVSGGAVQLYDSESATWYHYTVA